MFSASNAKRFSATSKWDKLLRTCSQYSIQDAVSILTSSSRRLCSSSRWIGQRKTMFASPLLLCAAAAAKASRSKSWHGFAQSGYAAQDGLSKVTLCQGLVYGTRAPQVVTHHFHLLVAACVEKKVYSRCQPASSIYVKMP